MRKSLPAVTGAMAFGLLVSSCSSTSPLASGNQPAGSSETQPTTNTATPTAVPTPTVAPTPVSTPEPKGVVAKVSERVIAWKPQYGDYIYYQVIVELKNTGNGWARVGAGQSDYTIVDGSGSVVTTGFFTYAFPEYLAPGATGYLEEDGLDDNSKIADYAEVQVDGRYDSVDPPDARFSFSGIKLKLDSFSGGLVATGFVTATADVSDAAVAVICLDSKGTALGITWTNLVQNLTAGQKKGFETVGDTPPLKVSQCATVVAEAMDTGF